MPDAATVARQVLCNFNSQRSCDVCIICEPHWGTTFSWDVAVVNHGSPWGYDTYVPIIFSGWNIPVKKNNRHVGTLDIAPTLALFLGTKLPSGSVGKSLLEGFK